MSVFKFTSGGWWLKIVFCFNWSSVYWSQYLLKGRIRFHHNLYQCIALFWVRGYWTITLLNDHIIEGSTSVNNERRITPFII
jgi:hypothetical protein